MEDVNVQKAIEHFEYGIKCDIFKEPVTSYAKLAVEALKKQEHLCVHSGKVSLVDGHIDNGMTDEDIIKALKCCMQSTSRDECKELHCPVYMERGCYISEQGMDEIILDLINRYKAENEKLNIELKAMRGAANSYKAEVEKNKIRIRDLTNYQVADVETRKKVVAKAKSEAIKEFAERIKAESYLNDGVFYIDKIVKEMTERK